MHINVLAIDIAKSVFQLCGVDHHGKIIKEKRVSRQRLLTTIHQFNPEVVVMEACGGANHWARQLISRGYQVKLIAPQYVKPFLKGNKNDMRDARAIAEAASRPTMPFVSAKTIEQQDIQSLLRIRESYVEIRIKICNQLRGLLAEYGIIVCKSVAKLRAKLPSIVDKLNDNGLSDQIKEWLEMQYHTLLFLEEKLDSCNIDITRLVKQHESCQRLKQIEGVGDISALTVVSQIGDGAEFKNGRHLSAYLGLVPRQHSSGEKCQLGRITKRGDRYLRKLLIHGGRAVVRCVDKKQDARSRLIKRIKDERGSNKAAVAVANRNARIILAMLKSGEPYRKAV